ncbi:MAG: hypothetical protein RLP45_04125, partial [Haliea sp.]
LADPRDWQQRLHLEVLLLRRQQQDFLFPADDFALALGDRLLLAGRDGEAARLRAVLENVERLEYILTGRDRQQGLVWQWLERRSG